MRQQHYISRKQFPSCFTNQYKNSTRFRLYASLIASQNTKAAVERPYAKGMIPETVGGFNYYGFTVSNRGWNYGNPSGDNYYIGIDENGYLYSGLQVNNHSEIIWRKFTGTLI